MTQSYLNIHDDTGNSANGLTAPSSAILAPMSRTEAEQALQRIRKATNELALMVYEFHERLGYKALGYETWQAFIDAEWSSKSNWYDMRRVGELITLTGLPVSTSASRALADAPDGLEEEVIMLASTTAKLDGANEVNVTYVKQTIEVVRTALVTGTIDGHILLTDAISEAVHESNARQRMHIASNSKRTEVYKGDDVDSAIDALMQASEHGKRVYVSVYVDNDESNDNEE